MYKYCTTHLLHKARHSSYLLLVKLMLSHQISIQRFLLMVLFVVQMLFKLFQEQWCVTSLLCLQLLKPKRRPLFYGWLHVTGAEKEKKKRGVFFSFLLRYIYTSAFLMHDQRDALQQRDNGTPLPTLMFNIKRPFWCLAPWAAHQR